MRVRSLACVLVLAVLAALCGAAFAGEAAKPVAKSKVLFMVGGAYRDQPGLYPILQKMLEGTGDFTVTVSKDLDQFKAENIKNYDLVVMYTTRLNPTKEQEQGLVGFVANGKGFVGIHCATDTFRNSDAQCWKMVGGRFTKHGHETFKVNITGKSNPSSRACLPLRSTTRATATSSTLEIKVIVLTRREKDGEPSAARCSTTARAACS